MAKEVMINGDKSAQLIALENGLQRYQAEHPLKTSAVKMSEVEDIALRMQKKRENRIPITFAVRKRFLEKCREIASQRNHKTRIHLEDLLRFRDELREEVQSPRSQVASFFEIFGFPNESEMLLSVLEKGVERVTSEIKHNYFYYQDFSFYYTRIISWWPWLRNPFAKYLLTVLAYYFFTPVFFCWIVDDEKVCPNIPERGPYAGWLTAMYFASATLSTVGYGDVSVIDANLEQPRWHVLMGILYMILSMAVLVTAISAVVSSTGNPLDRMHDWAMDHFVRSVDKEKFLYQLIHRTYMVKFSIIAVEFLALNLIGVLLARIFVRLSEEETQQWTWMTTFYWAVQTTTTIGYGDLDMPFDMRWVQIIFLVFSTYFVGDSLGRLGSLSREIGAVRRQYAWDRREVSEGLIIDMQAEEHDDKIDQYEFALASLLVLQKVTYDDIKPIMDKFRVLAGNNDYISIEDQALDQSNRTNSMNCDASDGELYALYE
ncbi:hypothetical protein FisN_17Hh268 [Fistulifera solaris]|uniref:Potassium channel domain-containing protein n=1 Tax=Fistulifera solaris TaxID=1519565 RepID=A0A1Z5JH44_FISSO|nr:hypothetical protein FisN_17Hh268 [Fistulifera solaris]|eukprot:GAX13327.1 hypothetical protein FisN_17Hh268 [Fistulifera solaris]